MQNVNREWIDNQNSYNQKQGFVNITITTPDKTVSISTLDASGSSLKKTVHCRAYDPMGLSLPYNNIQIELFNYSGEFDYLYDKYEYYNLPVAVEYGYCLSENLSVAGGEFVTTLIKKDGDILVIECLSTFELKSEENIIARDSSNEVVLFYAPGSYKVHLTADDLENQLIGIKGAEISAGLQKVGVDVITTESFNDQDILINPGESFSVAKSVQYSANLLLQRVYINRNGTVEFKEYASSPQRIIKSMNIYSKPQYSRGAKIKYISVDTNEINTTEKAAVQLNERRGHMAYDYGYPVSGRQVFMRNFIVDYNKSRIVEIGGPVVKVTRKNIEVAETQYVEEFGCSVVASTGVKSKGFEVIWTDSDYLTIYVAPNLKSVHIDREINPDGVVCDITNPYGVPTDLDKIAQYFSNRDMYTVNMRGDPAVDVGDYIWLSLKDDNDPATYQKALVLSSELTFDGCFKDRINVRIINNDFEEFEGMTHNALTAFTHDELSEFTHNNLTTKNIKE